MKLGPFETGSLKDEILEKIGLMGRHRFCFDTDQEPEPEPEPSPGPEDWLQGLPEEFRGHESLKSYKVVPPGQQDDDGNDIPEVGLVQVPASMVKSYIEQQPLLGRKTTIPKEDAKPEELDAFYSQLGMPDTAEAYELTKVEGMEEVPYSDEFEKEVRNWFREGRVTQEQAQFLYDKYQNYQKGQFDAANEQMQEDYTNGQNSLKETWANNTEANMKLADRAFHTLFDGEENDETPEGRAKLRVRMLLGNDPWFIEKMHKLSSLLGEDQLVGMEEGKDATGLTHEQLKEMQADPKYGVDKEFTKKVDDGYKRLFPGEG